MQKNTGFSFVIVIIALALVGGALVVSQRATSNLQLQTEVADKVGSPQMAAVSATDRRTLTDLERELTVAQNYKGINPTLYNDYDKKLKRLEAKGVNTKEARGLLAKLPVGGMEKGNGSASGSQGKSTVPGGGLKVACKPTNDGHQYYRTDHTFVIDPQEPDTMYVNVEHKGFYKTTDGGRTWVLKTKGLPADRRIDDLSKPCYTEYPATAIDPRNPKHIILAQGGPPTRFSAGFTRVGGLAESWDGAETWKPIIQDWMNIYVTDVAIDPTDSKTLYYTTTAEPATYNQAERNNVFVTKGLVYKTTNGGKSWQELPTGFLYRSTANNIHLDPKNPGDILITTFTSQSVQGNRNVQKVPQMGVLRSSDGGATWKALHSLPSDYEAVPWSVSSRHNSSHLFVSPWGPENQPPKSFYSLDRGETFLPSNNYLHIVAYDPHDDSSLHMLGYKRLDYMTSGEPKTLFESTDGGATWQPFGVIPKEVLAQPDRLKDISAIVWHPKEADTVFMTGAGGYIWKSTDSGKSWTAILSYDKLSSSPAVTNTSPKIESGNGGGITNESDPPLLLKSIGVDLGYFDATSGRAGDFVFTKNRLQFNVLLTEFGFTIPSNQSATGMDKRNPQPTFLLPLGTKVRSLVDGIVMSVPKLYSGDYSIMVAPSENSQWRYETEHVIKPLVNVGDRVTAGQVIAEVSPHNKDNNNGYGLVEIGILKGGNPPKHLCPFAYLDPSIKDDTQKKLRAFYASWEEYRDDSALHNETAQAVPGCLSLQAIDG